MMSRSLVKKSVIKFQKDYLSGYKAIALGVLYHKWSIRGNSQQRKWKNLFRNEYSQQKQAYELLTDLELLRFWKYNLNEDILREIDKNLLKYQIIVITRGSGKMSWYKTLKKDIS